MHEQDPFRLDFADSLIFEEIEEDLRLFAPQLKTATLAFEEALAADRLEEPVKDLAPLPPVKHYVFSPLGILPFKTHPVRRETQLADQHRKISNRLFKKCERQLNQQILDWQYEGYAND